jgi:hypothetical protein
MVFSDSGKMFSSLTQVLIELIRDSAPLSSEEKKLWISFGYHSISA